jgi:Anti-sigma-K factor rskA
MLIAMAAILGAGAVALGIGAFVHQRHHAARPPRATPVDATAPLKKAVALLASPQSERFPLAGSVGRLVLVVDDHGDGLLVVRNLGIAPAGRAYQAWVVPPGASAVPAARFAGGDRVVLLGRRVVQGARVAVTLERAGVREPTRQLRLVARRPS